MVYHIVNKVMVVSNNINLIKICLVMQVDWGQVFKDIQIHTSIILERPHYIMCLVSLKDHLSAVGPAHGVPSQMPYGSPHHSVPMNYQPHQVQHPLDVNVSNQYGSVKPSGNRNWKSTIQATLSSIVAANVAQSTSFSPRQPQSQSQLSPRPVMSPVKGPSASPLSSTWCYPTATICRSTSRV
ncbi:unnamed protein product [Danaus chrysippus]|uniref:(African queen) hypothetical protein n=1 Tax=Danaus chrysippus TaxID=151541 RepID=A0A8J2VT00_9NEOP|nr:unnamed protein product [Danaus chrysippus]